MWPKVSGFKIDDEGIRDEMAVLVQFFYYYLINNIGVGEISKPVNSVRNKGKRCASSDVTCNLTSDIFPRPVLYFINFTDLHILSVFERQLEGRSLN